MRTLAQELVALVPPSVLAALEDPQVTDVHVNPGGPVYLKTHAGRVASEERFDPSAVRRFLLVLAASKGVELTGRPSFATRLPEEDPFRGARLQAVLPPVVPSNSISVRVHPAQHFTLEKLEECGTIDERQAPRLRALVACRRNVLIVGGTSSGKTTLLSALLLHLKQIAPSERLVVLEETREISPECLPSDSVQLEPEDPFALGAEDRPRVGFVELVATALRMNPDRIVVGEIRGAEAFGLVDAWNTGHRGGLATLHAESVEGALLRLESLIRRDPRAGRGAFPAEIATAVDAVVVLERGEIPRVRRICSVDSALDRGRYRLTEE